VTNVREPRGTLGDAITRNSPKKTLLKVRLPSPNPARGEKKKKKHGEGPAAEDQKKVIKEERNS